jgi:16S rRNA (guanine(966)-N(2))-methyltransferase RsmD
MAKPAPRRASAPGRAQGRTQVRIIGGLWKRTPLPVLDAEGLRPTPDRVRETVFNWLHHLFDGEWSRLACLDLFAGSGALGFEAASRGARRVVMIEANAAAVRQLEAVKEKLGAQQVAVLRADAFTLVQGQPGAELRDGFGLIFLDPPYHQDAMARMLPACARLLTPDGLVYAELEQSLTAGPAPEWLAGWEVVRADKAGMVYFHLLRSNKTTSI